jgi:REP element-mobilizing transposase RayT
MPYDTSKHHPRNIHLRGYDHSQPGAYFITICTRERMCIFGEIVNGVMHLNEAGHIVAWTWQDLPNHVPNLIWDAFVFMPNRVHGTIIIMSRPRRGGFRTRPYGTRPYKTRIHGTRIQGTRPYGTSHPSARIKGIWPRFKKTTDGVGILEQVPWEELCVACPHFGDWIRKLEAL